MRTPKKRRGSSATPHTGQRVMKPPAATKAYLRFQCLCCNHCVSPGMFSTEGWKVYKQTGLCPDCQG